MNINAGTNQYNLSLKKMKEEKRPTFATIFDKLDARSKKLNPKNPLNAVMTNDQMYRYYLEETEPMLREMPDDYDLLDDVIGGKSLKDMKLSEFAKLLSGDLDGDRNVKYETLTAITTTNTTAPLIPSMISITSAPTPPPFAPTPTPYAPIIPAPSSLVATSIAAPVAVSGLVPTGTGSIPTAAAAPPAPAAAPAAAGSLSVSIPAAISAAASSAFAVLTGGGTSPAAAKPSPSGASIPSSAVASAAATAPATGVPTATPASGALSPTTAAAAGGSGTAAGGGAAGGVSASAVASSLVSGDEGNYNLWFGGTITGTNPLVYNNALTAGLSPPKVPDDITTIFSSTNLKWVNHIKAMNDYNEKLQIENKDPTGEYSFSFSIKQQSLINALKANGNNTDKVYKGIKDGTIDLKQYEPPKSPKSASAGGAKGGKGGGKKKK